MPIVEWSSAFEVGIAPFDDHHRHLFSLLNKTFDIFVQGQPEEQVGPVLDELGSYVGYHFYAEEQWMKEHGYPALPEHAREHETFVQRVRELRAGFVEGVPLTLEVLKFLQDWLVQHILQSDACYATAASGTGAAL